MVSERDNAAPPSFEVNCSSTGAIQGKKVAEHEECRGYLSWLEWNRVNVHICDMAAKLIAWHNDKMTSQRRRQFTKNASKTCM
jgi:hypothetical protein